MAFKPLRIPLSPNDLQPQEADPSSGGDLMAVKGLDLENLGTHLLQRSGNDMTFFDPSTGLKTLSELELDERIKVTSNDTTRDYLFNKIISGPGITLTETNDGANEKLQLDVNLFSQRIFSTVFGGIGNTKDVWLGYTVSPILSNVVPFTVPFAASIIGYSFTNSIDGCDADIEIYKNGSTVSELVRTFQIRNSRFAWDVTITPLSFAAGDRIAVFCRDQGVDPKDVVFSFLLRADDDTKTSGSGSTL